MGMNDRDYNRESFGLGGRQSSGGGRVLMRNPGWSIVIWLIVTIMIPKLFAIGHLSVYTGFQRLEVWRLLTFQFLHADGIMHVGFNMFGLWIFGPIVEEYLGRKKFLAFYLMCGLSGGLLFVILTVLGHVTGEDIPGLLHSDLSTPLIGASAGVFGVIMACAFVSPNTVIQLLFPPIPLKMRTLAYGYVGLALFNLLSGSSNAGGEAAHIGGAIAGFFFIRNSKLLVDFFDVTNDSRKPKTKKPKKTAATKYTKGMPSESEIDRILDKVNKEGLASLSEKEKKTLAKASKPDD
jgi:membrane associated rhomboid family serine protease